VVRTTAVRMTVVRMTVVRTTAVRTTATAVLPAMAKQKRPTQGRRTLHLQKCRHRCLATEATLGPKVTKEGWRRRDRKKEGRKEGEKEERMVKEREQARRKEGGREEGREGRKSYCHDISY
jgi:hypothetical protein